MKGFFTAIRTLTVFPLSWGADGAFSSSLPWFPVVGAVMGAMFYGLAEAWLLLPVPDWPLGGALVLVCCEVWVTRGLHLDGLADWADSIGVGPDKQRRLAVMKDVHMGSFGVTALVIALMARLVAYARIIDSHMGIWLICVFVLSRGLLVELIVSLPYARTEGGMGEPFVRGGTIRHRIIGIGLCIFMILPFGPHGLGMFVAGFIMVKLMARRFRNSFGGITGDLLGTASEVVHVSLAMAIALAGSQLSFLSRWGLVF